MSEFIVKLDGVITKVSIERLIKKYSGFRLWIPKNAKEQHVLAELLGYGEMVALCNRFGGRSVYIPKNYKDEVEKRQKMIIADFLNGETVDSLARKYNFSCRHVYSIVESKS